MILMSFATQPRIMIVSLEIKIWRQPEHCLIERKVVLAAASARHPECAKACIAGLGERGQSTGKATHYIHVSLWSNDWRRH